MTEEKKSPDQTEAIILEMMDIVMRISAINPRMLTRKNDDYGEGEIHTGLEMHTLRYIVTNPGCTVTEIAEAWSRTVGAISQVVKKLRNDGMVTQQPDPANERRNLLQPTERGLALDRAQRLRELERSKGLVRSLKGNYTNEQLSDTIAILRQFLLNASSKYSKVKQRREKNDLG